MPIARGLGLGLIAFAASFALHIVGGALNQGWLFAIAVGLIYLVAAGFPAFAALLSGAERGSWGWRATFVAGIVPGLILTAAALWAANDRAVAWWHIPVTPVLVVLTTLMVAYVARQLRFRRRTASTGAA